jgi:hypothetical protein
VGERVFVRLGVLVSVGVRLGEMALVEVGVLDGWAVRVKVEVRV